MRLAHISDLHILDLTNVSPKRFLNRRMIGGLNVFFRRMREHKIEIFENLIEDLIQERVDHVVVSGDVSNLALESEFLRAFHLLKLLGNAGKVTVVPGNHDYYTFRAADSRRFEKMFSSFMFERPFSDLDLNSYPFVKDVENVRIIGLCSASRTVPPLSFGRIGGAQLKRLEAILKSPDSRSKFICVVLHHAIHVRDSVAELTSRLLDRDDLLSVLGSCPVGLVLYGHDHHGLVWHREYPGIKTHFVCCGSSTRFTDDSATLAKYRIINISDNRITRIDTKIYEPSVRKFILQ